MAARKKADPAQAEQAAPAEEQSKELVIIPAESALEVFTTPGAIQPYLEQIREATVSQVFDMSTKEGQDGLRALAMKIVKSKVYIESIGKEESAKQKAIPLVIDATRRIADEYLCALRDEVRQPLTEWEETEKAKKAAAEALIAAEEARVLALDESIRLLVGAIKVDADSDQEAIQGNIDLVASYDPSAFAERSEEAAQIIADLSEELNYRLAKRIQYDLDQTELQELRDLKAKREQADREEDIRRKAAEEATQAANAAAQKKIDDAAAENLRLSNDRDANEARRIQEGIDSKAREQLAADNERKSIAAEQKVLDDEKAARAADAEHRHAIKIAAANGLMEVSGISSDQARAIVRALCSNSINHISINF
jgi:colicin import membrane protein